MNVGLNELGSNDTLPFIPWAMTHTSWEMFTNLSLKLTFKPFVVQIPTENKFFRIFGTYNTSSIRPFSQRPFTNFFISIEPIPFASHSPVSPSEISIFWHSRISLNHLRRKVMCRDALLSVIQTSLISTSKILSHITLLRETFSRDSPSVATNVFTSLFLRSLFFFFERQFLNKWPSFPHVQQMNLPLELDWFGFFFAFVFSFFQPCNEVAARALDAASMSVNRPSSEMSRSWSFWIVCWSAGTLSQVLTKVWNLVERLSRIDLEFTRNFTRKTNETRLATTYIPRCETGREVWLWRQLQRGDFKKRNYNHNTNTNVENRTHTHTHIHTHTHTHTHTHIHPDAS